MELIVKEFNSLSVKELFEIYHLRSQIFIVEQNCAYQDVDDKDTVSNHLMIFENKKLIGYCRILPPNSSYMEPSIGRVAINKDFRHNGLGKFLMQEAINKTKNLFEEHAIVISAQFYLLKFYTDLGFKVEGSQYLEDDIPHIKMRLL
ncbi:GNAT family N-acetyltransferase [Aurantibacillus circumpalustris]|uniref:GNAT family N-acetyltransferase n=1 Tax=Aurantibacillus circumpalustris TaxID=3036359 RepID=UPI00295BAE92|nr:GNAT family N-acetyltransferase [Aurantibacillus circumpalustris]